LGLEGETPLPHNESMEYTKPKKRLSGWSN
jgi:hypothetical protein